MLRVRSSFCMDTASCSIYNYTLNEICPANAVPSSFPTKGHHQMKPTKIDAINGVSVYPVKTKGTTNLNASEFYTAQLSASTLELLADDNCTATKLPNKLRKLFASVGLDSPNTAGGEVPSAVLIREGFGQVKVPYKN
jgi:hypothetical protein